VAEEIMAGEAKISPAQRGYLLKLIRTKNVEHGGKTDLILKCLRISEDPEEFGMSKKKASELITWYEAQKDKPDAQQNGNDLPDVKAGRYAVNNEQGKLAFYRVSRPTDGKWKGWTFVDVMASDERHPIKGFAAKKAILEKIAADPDAGPRFGREIGSCYVCGRTLTDELSRQLGIGPVCRSL
jgi:hypothetical protein